MSFTTPIAESDVTSLVADLALKAALAGPTLTNTPAAPTAAQGTNTTQLATTAMVASEVTLLAPKANPTLTGTVTVPNGASATNIAAYGQIPTPGSVGGPAKIVFRTSNSATYSNSSLQSDDTLLWAVGANDRWIVQAYITFTAADGAGAAATADVHTGWSVPASGAMQHGTLAEVGSTFPGYGATATGNTPTALKTAAQATTVSGAAALTFGMSFAGLYTGGGTSGNVTFQWAQNTTNAATLQINTNSLLICWRVA